MRGAANAESRAQIVIEDAQHPLQQLAGDRGAHVVQRQMRRRERDAQTRRRQHHHRMRAAGALGQIFGVARERDAGVVDDALLHRRRDHRIELAGHAAVDGAIEQLQHVARVGAIELARCEPALRRARAERAACRRDAAAGALPGA